MDKKVIVEESKKIIITTTVETDFFRFFYDVFHIFKLYNLSTLEVKAVILSYFNNKPKFPLFLEKTQIPYSSIGINYKGEDLLFSFAHEDFPHGYRKLSWVHEDRERTLRDQTLSIVQQFGLGKQSFYIKIKDLKNKKGTIEAKQKNIIDKSKLNRTVKSLSSMEKELNDVLQRRIKEGFEIMGNIKLPSYLEYLRTQPKIEPKSTEKNEIIEEIKKTIEEINIIAVILNKAYEVEKAVKRIISKYDQDIKNNFLVSGISLSLSPNVFALVSLQTEINEYYKDLLQEKQTQDELTNTHQDIEEIKGVVDRQKSASDTIKEIMEMATYLDLKDYVLDYLDKINKSATGNDYISQLYDFYYGVSKLHKKKIEQERATKQFKELMDTAEKISSF